MIVLNGATKVPVTEFMKTPERELISVCDNKCGFIVREYLSRGLIVDSTIITTQLDNEKEKDYLPSSDMKMYAIERRLASKNKTTLAEIYYQLLV